MCALWGLYHITLRPTNQKWQMTTWDHDNWVSVGLCLWLFLWCSFLWVLKNHPWTSDVKGAVLLTLFMDISVCSYGEEIVLFWSVRIASLQMLWSWCFTRTRPPMHLQVWGLGSQSESSGGEEGQMHWVGISSNTGVVEDCCVKTHWLSCPLSVVLWTCLTGRRAWNKVKTLSQGCWGKGCQETSP